jgi:adenylyl-sulfate kinase
MGAGPCTIWLTGLPGSGKTTIAYGLERRLFDLGKNAYVIDGQNVRLGFSRDLGFNADDRRENIRRAAEFARMLNDAGLIAICAFVSPSADDRAMAKEIVGPEQFHEIYLSAPLDVCRQRDSSGIYDKGESGEIAFVSGVTAPYDVPAEPALDIETHQVSPADAIAQLVQHLF